MEKYKNWIKKNPVEVMIIISAMILAVFYMVLILTGTD
jgi:hypothetical protein